MVEQIKVYVDDIIFKSAEQMREAMVQTWPEALDSYDEKFCKSVCVGRVNTPYGTVWFDLGNEHGSIAGEYTGYFILNNKLVKCNLKVISEV